MEQPTDPLARQLALSALTTEHFNLQTARMGTIAEANGRSTLYLSTLSSAVIAIAFIGQTSQLGDSFYLFALTLLPPVFLLGVFSFLRLVQTSIEDLVYAVGSFRIRQYFLGLDPTARPCSWATRSGVSGGQRPWSRSCTRARARTCREPGSPTGLARPSRYERHGSQAACA